MKSSDPKTTAIVYTKSLAERVASMKDTYHVGETMVVGAAMLNDSSEPVFFPNMFDIQLSIRYEGRSEG
jgi:hypothetical protein